MAKKLIPRRKRGGILKGQDDTQVPHLPKEVKIDVRNSGFFRDPTDSRIIITDPTTLESDTIFYEPHFIDTYGILQYKSVGSPYKSKNSYMKPEEWEKLKRDFENYLLNRSFAQKILDYIWRWGEEHDDHKDHSNIKYIH